MAKATYFYSCICGEKGETTFETGDFADHKFYQRQAEDKYLNTPATCTSKATYFYSCVCGEKGETTFEGDTIGNHDFANNQPCTHCDASYGLKYKLSTDGKTYSVESIGDCGDTNIVIPKYFNGLLVDKIETCAFLDNQDIVNVVIGDGVTTISDNAFAYCVALKNVTFPANTLTTIGSWAFSGCSSIKSMVLPDSVTFIGGGAFSYCENLESITLSKNITAVNEFTFSGCTSLISITIPDKVTTLGDSAFSGCSNFVWIILPKGRISVGNGAFDYCSSFTYLFFKGEEKVWNNVFFYGSTDFFYTAMLYYFSPIKPKSQNTHWYYDSDGETPIIWKNFT